jgi:hypothetical protein
MKGRLANRLGYVGAGIGLTLFVVFGLLPGSFIGGVVGLNIAGAIFGMPVEPTVLSRVVIAVSMLLGVLVTGTVFVIVGAVVGWILGTAVDAVLGGKEAEKDDKKMLKV